MTEFKKCLATIDEVRSATDALNDHAAVDRDIDVAKALLDKFDDDVVPNLRIRVGKLLAKAREKDPDKQIYNEGMCAKIEDLAKQADELCAAFDAAVPYAHEAVHAALKERVQAQQQRAALAINTAEIAKREAEARQLMKYEYGSWTRAMAADKEADYEVAFQKKTAREEREWQAELDRRAAELAALDRYARSVWLPAAPEAVNGTVGQRATQAFWNDSGLQEPKVLARHLLNLIDMLMSDPSSANVAKLRNNNATVLEHFGHPYATAVTEFDELAEMDANEARLTYAATERLLCVVGYKPHYELSGGFARPMPPAGCAWRLAPCPWDLYSERFLLLKEPDPAVDTEEWMQWHERLGDIHKHFSQRFLSSSLR